MATGLGFPAISTPGSLDLRAIQTAVGNARQRIEALERLIVTLTSAATTGSSGNAVSSAQFNALRNQVFSLDVRVTALENATIDLEALISALPYNSGASSDMLVPVVIGGIAVTVTAGDIAALANSITVDLAALIDALPFQSGADPGMMVPVTLYGIGFRITVEAIAALAPSSGVQLFNVNVFTANQSVAPVSLVDGANIATDASLGNNFEVTLGGNRTLDNPSNATGGMVCNWVIRQDGTGGRTLTFGSAFDFGTAGAPTLSTGANVADFFSAYYFVGTSKWLASFRKGA